MQLPEHAAHAIRRLERAGFEAWAVGGCVRDSLRGVEPHDWDLCTSASPAQMQAVFADARVLTPDSGSTLTCTDGETLEITTYRTEGGYWTGGIRTACAVTDIRGSGRRFRSVRWRGTGTRSVRPFDGQTDLKNGVLRAVGDADTRSETRCASCADCASHQAGFCHRAGNRRCHAAAGIA
ncbi:MAG: hypothetical protein ACLSDM_06385 [Butyricicoccus sp.]